MYVSAYDPIVDSLIEKLDDKTDDAPARKLEERIGAIFKKAADQAYYDVFDVVRDCLLSNMENAIRDAARRLAEQYVKSALAGDEKTFADMFDFQHEWKDGHYWTEGSRLPLGVDLRRRLLIAHHSLFENRAISDLEGELAAVKRARKLGSWRTMMAADIGVEPTEAAP